MSTRDTAGFSIMADGSHARGQVAKGGAHHRTGLGLGAVWAGVDFVFAVSAGMVALRLHSLFSISSIEKQIEASTGGSAHLLAFIPIFSLYVILVGRVLGLYHIVKSKSFLNEQRMAVQTVFVSSLLLCGTLFLIRYIYASRVVVGFTAVVTLLLMMLSRAIWHSLRERRFLSGLETRNALIIGNGKVGQALRNHFRALPRLGFRFKGFITLDTTEASLKSPEVLGQIKDCVELARLHFVDEIYFSTPAHRELVTQVVDEAKAYGIEVRVVPDLYEGLAWNAPVEYVGQFPTILLHHNDFSAGAFAVKRVVDVCLSALALILLSPMIFLIAAIVKLDSQGPVFYRAARIGRKGRSFTCYKFRTMQADADKRREELEHLNEREGILFKIDNDPRITKSGRWLRRYSIDELPQLINVFLGEMSLVGPRPPLASEVEMYEVKHLRRLDVLPGITGLWQVEAREDPSFDSYISLDTAYVDTWNLRMDFKIMARTLGVIVRGTGR
jgi:exopolysaccharide biosynthesis polyprenyl glycosylphosphotransferase